ncbi:MAG: ATP-binding protein [Desulfobulbaceae bacterium]|nr:ATP-binding protein [Desulfobulbaceae bacterium]HIJ90965.1 PAS domain-containing protein [Deltaproteobacteria bacterium]
MEEALILPLFPVYLADYLGATMMVIFAFCSLFYAKRLTRLEPKSILWAYFFWFSLVMVIFSISRGVGHLLPYVFRLAHLSELWDTLDPYSGGLNTIALCGVAILTLHYHSTAILIDRAKSDALSLEIANERLKEAHADLSRLNQTLEEQVEERTHDLRLSEEKFRGFFEGSKDMIYFCDGSGRLCDINESGLHLLGVERRQDILGQPLAEFFLDRQRGAQYRALLASDGLVKDFEAEFVGREDGPLYLMITASAITDRVGSLQGCQGIAKDLTHFKKMMEQLVHSEKMTSVGQLAAGVAHEINTPLGIILGYAQLLEEDFPKETEVNETLRIIEKQAKICRRIVADLLNFSRHAQEHNKLYGDLNQCLEEVLAIVNHTLNMDHIFIHRCLAENLPKTCFDNERLRQVFVNLLTNAHHAIGSEGIIGVWTRWYPESGQIEVVIGDSGSGIPQDQLGRIFDPFYTTKGVGKGTGLGLSVSFGIIQDHNGRIEVKSPPLEPEFVTLDMHTTFHIFLPIISAVQEKEQ